MSTLARRIGALEDARLRDMAERVAAEQGLPVDELLGGARRIAAEERRLRRQGLPEREVGRRLMAWVAADVGVDPDELVMEWERDLRRRA